MDQGCGWPIVGTPCPAMDDDPPARVSAEQMAVALLRAWTGNRYGLCETALEIVIEGCDRLPTFHEVPPLLARCGTCRSPNCKCPLVSVELPAPVHSMVEVSVGGAVVDPSTYAVYDWRTLERTDGGEWPRGEVWQVTYYRGIPVPEGGKVAAGLLACELAKSFAGDSSCALPKRLQSISRQGVTVAFIDQFDGLDKGLTGIWAIDSWVASANRKPLGGSVLSPDVQKVRTRRLTWTHKTPTPL